MEGGGDVGRLGVVGGGGVVGEIADEDEAGDVAGEAEEELAVAGLGGKDPVGVAAVGDDECGDLGDWGGGRGGGVEDSGAERGGGGVGGGEGEGDEAGWGEVAESGGVDVPAWPRRRHGRSLVQARRVSSCLRSLWNNLR